LALRNHYAPLATTAPLQLRRQLNILALSTRIQLVALRTPLQRRVMHAQQTLHHPQPPPPQLHVSLPELVLTQVLLTQASL